MHIHTLTHTHGLAHPSVCQWGACCPGRDTQGPGDTGKDTRLEGRRDGREEGGTPASKSQVLRCETSILLC